MADASANLMFPVVETTTGRIRGIANTGVRTFLGVPYGEGTASHRYQAPRPRKPWSGVRDCFGPGAVAPQVPMPLTSTFSQLIFYERTLADGGMSEDCLSLNIWTQGAHDGRRRPVVCILHGGGYAHGSANSAIYDGAQLALEQDVVVVAINHRLGSLGYLGIAGLHQDERFADAGHCGLLDIVMALQWLCANADVFGADPDRVTLMGESGGGWKVTALMAMPMARGLFHRAIVQSGSGPDFWDEDQGAALAAALLAALDLTLENAEQLLSLDFTQVLAAQAKVGSVAFLPVLHPHVLPAPMLAAKGLAISRDIPLIVSTTLDDAGLFFNHFDLDEAGLEALLITQFGQMAKPMLALYRAHRPHKSAYLLHAEIITDAGFRRYAHHHATAKAQMGGAPVWTYRWDWPSPAWDGRFGAAHAMDVSASLAHCRDSLLGGGVANGRMLTTFLSGAVCQFAATGDPRTAERAEWVPFTASARNCLLLGTTVTLAQDPDADLRRFWDEMPMAANLLG
jgi:para-nitrobenzyl esterase